MCVWLLPIRLPLWHHRACMATYYPGILPPKYHADFKLVESINSRNNSVSDMVEIACFNCSDLNDHGKMEIYHGLAPGAMVDHALWHQIMVNSYTVDCSVQGCGISSAFAMEIPQSCTMMHQIPMVSVTEQFPSFHYPESKFCNFDHIFISCCIRSCPFDNFQCSQWWILIEMTTFALQCIFSFFQVINTLISYWTLHSYTYQNLTYNS